MERGVEFVDWKCYIIARNRNHKEFNMDQDLIRVLEKISNTLEESTATLNRIADHYDGVVPVMTRNQKRVEEAHNEVEDNRSPLDRMYEGLFKPQEN